MFNQFLLPRAMFFIQGSALEVCLVILKLREGKFGFDLPNAGSIPWSNI